MAHYDNNNELLPLVDEQGNIIGSTTRGECHSGSKLLHPVVHLHVFNSQGKLYLQKRPAWKDIQPNKWDTAVGGHIDLGEDTETALKREAREELNITDFIPEFSANYIFESEYERELIFAYKTVYDEAIRPSDELDDGRFWTMQEIRDNMETGIFTPNFENEFKRLLSNL
ncbi:Nudix hydrolase [termite gut metagenome]|uniref:Nudix hydrolase n=1 Tax=termite gut metagenome TaxID=433724 RepID=A0A5J4SI46_9ZZZZ